MTNQNPASSNPQSAKLSQEILSKVNAHADRSIDRLFADIDELLSGDLSGDIPPASTQQQYRYPPSGASGRQHQRIADTQRQQPQPQQYLPQGDFTPPPETVEPPQPQQPQQPPQAKPKRQKPQSMPLWMKAFLGIGVTSIALSSLLLWLINEHKIQLPKNMDVSWLPFMSQSQISSDDAKFAEYMRKSISKIESANTQANSAPAPTNAAPAPENAAPTAVNSPTSTISANPGVITIKPDPAASQIPISLIKTLPTGDRPGAIFEINSQAQTVYAGDKIGKSDWSLLTVAKGEVIVKKVGGVIRSIYVGQKF
jgi:hypothetical protein